MAADTAQPTDSGPSQSAGSKLRHLKRQIEHLSFALLALSGVVLSFLLLGLRGRDTWLIFAMIMEGGALIVISVFGGTWRRPVAAVAIAQDAGSVGPLVALMQPYFSRAAGKRNRQVAGALAAILPKVTAEDMRALAGREARLLYRRITPALAAREPAFALALVRSLPRALDTRALPYVEAAARPATLPRFAPELADAIRACLPLLLAQRERERRGETLLRPAAPSDGADVLLHAARHPADEPAELLLRSAEAEQRADGTE